MANNAPELSPSPRPVTGPGARYGSDLARSDDWILQLGAAEIVEIDAAVAAFRASGVPMQEIGEQSFPLPPVFAPRYGSLTPGDRGGIIVPGTRLSVSLAE